MSPLPIGEITKECQDTLKQLFRDTPTIQGQEWADIQLRELNLWAATLGVFAAGDYSIDYRLADNKQVTNVIISLLRALHGNLKLYRNLLLRGAVEETIAEQSGDEEDSESDTPPLSYIQSLKQREELIEDALSRLERLAIKLRREGAERAAMLALSFEPHSKDKVPIPLRPDFESSVRWTLARSFDSAAKIRRNNERTPGKMQWPKAEPDLELEVAPTVDEHFEVDQYLRDRLESTMVARWRRICYNRHRSNRLAGPPVTEAVQMEGQQIKAKTGVLEEKQVVKSLAGSKPPQHLKAPNASRPASTASRLPADVLINPSTDLEHKPTRTIITKVKAGEIPIPQPPEIKEGMRNFDCPLCGRPQPVELAEKKNWRIHVMHDLAPYICLIDQCDSPNKTYSTHDEWLAHMDTKHSQSYWVCRYCTTEGKKFDLPAAYEQHMLLTHSDIGLTSADVALSIKHFAQYEPRTYDQCYFCGFVPEAYVGNTQCTDAQKQITEHMVQKHMHQFALCCLPWDFSGVDGRSSFEPASSSGTASDEARQWVFDDENLSLATDAVQGPALTAGVAATFDEIKKRWNTPKLKSEELRSQNDDKVEKWKSEVVPGGDPEEPPSLDDNDGPTAERRLSLPPPTQLEAPAACDTLPNIAEKEEQTDDDNDIAEEQLSDTELHHQALLDLITSGEASSVSEYVSRHKLDLSFTYDFDKKLEGNLMHTAIYCKSVSCVRALLPWRATLDWSVLSIGYPMSLAVLTEQPDIVQLLMSADFEMHRPKYDHACPMAFACAAGYLDIVKMLLAHDSSQVHDRMYFSPRQFMRPSGVDRSTVAYMPVADSNAGESGEIISFEGPPIFLAAIYGHLDIVRHLLEHGAKPATNADLEILIEVQTQIEPITGGEEARSQIRNFSDSECPLVTWCATQNKSDLLKILIDAGASFDELDKRGSNALGRACCSGAHESILFLLERMEDLHTRQEHLNQALVDVCAGNRIDSAKLLLAEGANVDAVVAESDTALAKACRMGNLTMVKFLLDHGADVEHEGGSHRRPLAVAARQGHADIVSLLIARGALVNGRSHGAGPEDPDSTALLHSTIPRSATCMTILLQQGADVRDADADGDTALHWAAIYGNLEHMRLLLKHGAELEPTGWGGMTPLLRAVYNGMWDMVSVLLQHEANVNVRSKSQATPLIHAAAHADQDILEKLLACGADINAQDLEGHTALFRACTAGAIENVEALLAAGADFELRDIEGLTPAFAACQHGHANIVKALIEQGARLQIADTHGDSMILAVVTGGYNECLQILMDAEVLQGAVDEIWIPALFAAVERGRASCLPLLLRRAPVDAINDNEETPLLAAARTGNSSCMEILLGHGASTVVTNSFGSTVLHIAANASESTACLEVLLKCGIDVDLVDSKGRTALLYIAGCQSYRLHSQLLAAERCLIKHKADVLKTDKQGRTALTIALECGCNEEVEVLIGALPAPKGKCLDRLDQTDMTALMYARTESHITLLLEAGASLELRNSCGKTALDVAFDKARADSVRGLLIAGAKPELPAVSSATLRKILPILNVLASEHDEGLVACEPARELLEAANRRAEALMAQGDVLASLNDAQIRLFDDAIERYRERRSNAVPKRKVAFSDT